MIWPLPMGTSHRYPITRAYLTALNNDLAREAIQAIYAAERIAGPEAAEPIRAAWGGDPERHYDRTWIRYVEIERLSCEAYFTHRLPSLWD